MREIAVECLTVIYFHQEFVIIAVIDTEDESSTVLSGINGEPDRSL